VGKESVKVEEAAAVVVVEKVEEAAVVIVVKKATAPVAIGAAVDQQKTV
jgi:hypothetical protein